MLNQLQVPADYTGIALPGVHAIKVDAPVGSRVEVQIQGGAAMARDPAFDYACLIGLLLVSTVFGMYLGYKLGRKKALKTT